MSHREEDDWFEDVELEPERRRPGERDDDWFHEEDRPPSRGAPLRLDRRVLLVAAIAIALLLGALAAAGVFSGGSSTSEPVTPTTSTTPTTAPATTTTPPAQTVTPPTVALKPGDTGAQVRLLQRELQSLGFSTGKVDGQYGPATEAAVKKFQAAHNLKDDGVVGPATLAALAKAARGG